MDAPRNTPEGPLRLVCRCLGVSSARIAAVVRTGGATDIAAVGRATGAGTGCTTCHAELEEIVRACQGQPVPAVTREVNRRTCSDETRLRIDAALELGPTRLVPPGASLELVSVEGLRVELLLRAARDPELERAIAERLRKLVCPDLEVVFA